MAISFHQEFNNFTENAKSVILTVKMFFALVFSNNCEISDIVQRYCVDSLFQQYSNSLSCRLIVLQLRWACEMTII